MSPAYGRAANLAEGRRAGASRQSAVRGFRPTVIRRVNAIAPSLVVVTFDLPYTVSGVADRHYYGTGLIVDTERGLVVVDRNTVPVAIGDVTVTFAGSLEVRAKVEQLASVAQSGESCRTTRPRSAIRRFAPPGI